MKTESIISNSKFAVATVDGVTSKARSIAKVFPFRSTINAFAVGPSKPRNTNTVTNLKFRTDSFPDLFNTTNNLVAQYKRQLGIRQFAIDHVEICPAHCAGNNSHKKLSPSRTWLFHIPESKRLPRPIKNHRAHG
jgi:hypothetical protein